MYFFGMKTYIGVDTKSGLAQGKNHELTTGKVCFSADTRFWSLKQRGLKAAGTSKHFKRRLRILVDGSLVFSSFVRPGVSHY